MIPSYFTVDFWRNMMDRDVGDLLKAVELLAEIGEWNELDRRVTDFVATTVYKVPQARERIAQKITAGTHYYPLHELVPAQRREEGFRRAREIFERIDCRVS